MSNQTSKKIMSRHAANRPPTAYDLSSFLDSDSDCEDLSVPSKSRRNKSPPQRVILPADWVESPAKPASELVVDTDSGESSGVDSDSREERRHYTPPSYLTYTPPSYLAKGGRTFSRYSDLKSGVTSPDIDRTTSSSDYKDPPSCNLDHFMDSDSDCGTPEKPVARRRNQF